MALFPGKKDAPMHERQLFAPLDQGQGGDKYKPVSENSELIPGLEQLQGATENREQEDALRMKIIESMNAKLEGLSVEELQAELEKLG